LNEPKPGAAPTVVSLKRLAAELVALPNEWTAYVNRRTGESYMVSEEDEAALAEPDDLDMPDWRREELPKIREVTESADWLALPSKFDIHEHVIMQQFCLELDDGRQRETLLDAIHRKGAFRRFKDLIRRYDIEQQWYDYRDREVERIVADWLDEKGIAYEK
jgi:hypothetical protein